MDQITIQNFVLQMCTIATTNEVGANALHKALVSFSPHKLVTPPPHVFLTDCTKFISHTPNFLKVGEFFEKLKCRASRYADRISFHSNPPPRAASSYVFCPQPRYLAPSALIRKHIAEDVFGLFSFHDLELTLDDLVNIWKERSLEAAGKRENRQ